MSQTFTGVFDGAVIRLDGEPGLPPNTRVRVIVEPDLPAHPLLADVPPLPTLPPSPGSFLRVARELKLDGPPDWSENWEKYSRDGADPSPPAR